MARKPETMTFSGSLEPLVQKPLDGRRKVNLISDLTAAASFPYIFSGLDVYCDENQKWYTFLGGDQTDINNWRMEGSGGGGSTDWSDITNKPTDLVQDASYVHTDNNYTTSDKDKLASLENYDDTALAARVTANETAIAERYTKAEDDALLADKADKATTYTKAETDQKILDELENFDKLDYVIVNELPTTGEQGVRYLVKHPTDAQYEEYIYVNDAWHDIGATSDVNLDNYYNKTETDALLVNKANQSSVLALQNSLEGVRTEAEGTQAELTQFKSDYVIDMAGKQTMAVINWQYEFFHAELLEMLKCGGAVVEWGNQTYMPVVGFKDEVVEGDRVVNVFVHNTASINGISLFWFTWTVAEDDKETVKMSPDSSSHEVTAVGVPWVAAQLSYKADVTYVDDALAEKADFSITETQGENNNINVSAVIEDGNDQLEFDYTKRNGAVISEAITTTVGGDEISLATFSGVNAAINREQKWFYIYKGETTATEIELAINKRQQLWFVDQEDLQNATKPAVVLYKDTGVVLIRVLSRVQNDVSFDDWVISTSRGQTRYTKTERPIATKAYVDGKTITPTGRGIAKTGTVEQAVAAGATVEITIDVSDLGFASANDFEIIGSVTGIGSEKATYGIHSKTATTVTIGLYAESATTLYFHYTIIGKGYGHAVSGWGVATVGTLTQSISSNVTSYANIDISSLGFENRSDYVITGNLSGTHSQHGAWGTDESQTTASNIRIGMFCTESTTLTLNYVIVAKGYAGGQYSGNIPAGGNEGEALVKTSNEDGACGWMKVGVNIEVGKEKWQGTYTDENGETFQVYSKMVYIPSLPSTAGITAYDHGVANIKQILNIYGFTTDGFVLNAPRQNVQDNITIYQASKGASNQTFSIEVGKDRSSKKAYVVMVYAKNN